VWGYFGKGEHLLVAARGMGLWQLVAGGATSQLPWLATTGGSGSTTKQKK